MPTVANDGNIPFGSQVVSINGTEYVAEDIDFTEKSSSHIRRNEINVPNGAVYIKDLTTGKMTLQLESNTTAIPESQSVVSMTFRGAAKDFIITNVSQPQKQDQIHKITMEITEVLNPGNVGTS